MMKELKFTRKKTTNVGRLQGKHEQINTQNPWSQGACWIRGGEEHLKNLKTQNIQKTSKWVQLKLGWVNKYSQFVPYILLGIHCLAKMNQHLH